MTRSVTSAVDDDIRYVVSSKIAWNIILIAAMLLCELLGKMLQEPTFCEVN